MSGYEMATEPEPELVLVALVAANGVIGDGEDQPFRFREDFARFKALTTGHPLLMGRRTHEAIGRALPGRRTIVLTRDRQWRDDAVDVAHDLDEALALAEDLPGGEEVMVLGGGEIYRATIDRAHRLELTEVDAPARGDITFPEIDPAQWREVARDDRAAFAFVTYARG
ncbi:dihydrofolate reductase [Mobilicoccus pelagius]|uniref:Dihydrofolate reductase n=1 Tax=Mobilicoccus pelagius NBRC 104925 TaxID=1089455 RepID=H5UNR1_9MICO|nr:dihydrofolate reductase [Mobilicoccus pelagius]GAB47369.1 dihydrofolate reductase [Mobilicoccus pelagius NBRC 104925]